ncbi:MAG: orotate phosphoribosyltransferase [Nitrospinota bacterium]
MEGAREGNLSGPARWGPREGNLSGPARWGPREGNPSGPARWGPREELRRLLLERSYERRRVILTSGRESDFYIDARQTTLHPRGAYLAGRLLWEMLRGVSVEAVGGPETGAYPIVTAMAVVSELEGQPLGAFIVRKEPKGHGPSVHRTGRWVEGASNLRPGMEVAMVEDVVTTGASLLRAVEKAEEFGCRVARVLALVDREEGGRENLAAAGFDLHPLFTRNSLLGEPPARP